MCINSINSICLIPRPEFCNFHGRQCSMAKETSPNPLRGFTNDNDDVPNVHRHTTMQKVTHLELMFGQIANFCPIISRNSIVKSPVTLSSV